jgi:hypothetical protein
VQKAICATSRPRFVQAGLGEREPEMFDGALGNGSQRSLAELSSDEDEDSPQPFTASKNASTSVPRDSSHNPRHSPSLLRLSSLPLVHGARRLHVRKTFLMVSLPVAPRESAPDGSGELSGHDDL